MHKLTARPNASSLTYTEGYEMLVISRKPGEVLKIGDNITVTVLGVRGNVLRLGIEAPRDVRVLRGELPRWHEEPPLTPPGRKLAALAG
jgi:carbon storage regulator CsrA